MKIKLFALVMLIGLPSLYAKAGGVAPLSIMNVQSTLSTGEDETMNMVKINLFSLAVKNISLQYERVLNRKFSAAMGLRFMPSTSLPLSNIASKQLTDNAQAQNALQQFKIGGFALTPEARLYLSKKGYGSGFYLSLFYRYAHFNTNNLGVDITNDSGEVTGHVNLSGKFNTSTVGLMMGAQWKIGQYVVLDWWIFGPQFGSFSGSLSGTSEQTLGPADQQSIRDHINKYKIPFVTETNEVGPHSASVTLKGPWFGIRTGLAIGVQF